MTPGQIEDIDVNLQLSFCKNNHPVKLENQGVENIINILDICTGANLERLAVADTTAHSGTAQAPQCPPRQRCTGFVRHH